MSLPSSPSPPAVIPELAKLDAIRLARDWSMARLAAEMAEQGHRISPRTLHYLLRGKPTNAKQPFDRTVHKIRLYLAYLRGLNKRNRRRRKITAAKRAAASTTKPEGGVYAADR